MTTPAHGDIDAVALQARALTRFEQEAGAAVHAAERAAADVADTIESELRDRRVALARAQEALAACQQAEGANCDAELQRVRHARARVEAAEQGLRTAQEARSAFTAPKTRFVRESGRVTQEGLGLLSSMSSDLETYLQSMRASARTGDGAAGGRVDGAAAPAADGLPSGWAMVPLASIDDADSPVSGAASFGKGYSPEDLAWAFDALHEVVLPAMARGKSLDYFQGRDQAEGRIGSRSYSDTYLGFFGLDSAIKLDAVPGGTFSVTNGYHRLWVAKQLGLDEVPARVAP